MSGMAPLNRLALLISLFRDCGDEQTIAALCTDDDGGAVHLRYGDLREILTTAVGADERLARIADWHVRETGPGGMVGDYCIECGKRWPCDTRRMAEGTYKDEDG